MYRKERLINIQKDKMLVINSPIECSEFARMIAEEAYKAGACDVVINYNDEKFNKIKYENTSTEILAFTPQFEKDKYNQLTNYGVHKDDILFKINDLNVNDFASQGQRRLVVMAFKLSLKDYIIKKTGKIPILLLDDLLSELDVYKQTNLLNCIDDNIQTIITTSVLSNSLKIINKELNIQTIESGNIIKNKEVIK